MSRALEQVRRLSEIKYDLGQSLDIHQAQRSRTPSGRAAAIILVLFLALPHEFWESTGLTRVVSPGWSLGYSAGPGPQQSSTCSVIALELGGRNVACPRPAEELVAALNPGALITIRQ